MGINKKRVTVHNQLDSNSLYLFLLKKVSINKSDFVKYKN